LGLTPWLIGKLKTWGKEGEKMCVCSLKRKSNQAILFSKNNGFTYLQKIFCLVVPVHAPGKCFTLLNVAP